MTTPHVPEAIKFHGFNGGHKHKVVTTDLSIINFSPGLIRMGFETYQGINKIAAKYHKELKDKVFSIEGKQYKILKVFSTGASIKLRVQSMDIPSIPEVSDNAC